MARQRDPGDQCGDQLLPRCVASLFDVLLERFAPDVSRHPRRKKEGAGCAWARARVRTVSFVLTMLKALSNKVSQRSWHGERVARVTSRMTPAAVQRRGAVDEAATVAPIT